jgi:hypothetical protein
LIPVALALRVIMGKKRFNSWVRSMQIRMPSNIKSKKELIDSLGKANYDALIFGNAVKTHYGSKKEFFFWEFENGRWIAVFSKQVPITKIKQFISNFDTANNTNFFENESKYNEKTIKKKITEIYRAPTNFKDKNILMKTLREYGLEPNVENNNIIVKIDKTELKFLNKDNGPFTVEIINALDLKDIFNQLSLMDESYKNNVQSYSYEQLKQNLNERNMQIDYEEVLEDNSIVITVNLDH